MCIKQAVPVLAYLFNYELIIIVSSQRIKNICVNIKICFFKGTFMYNLFRFCFNLISVLGSFKYLKLQYCNYISFIIIINWNLTQRAILIEILYPIPTILYQSMQSKAKTHHKRRNIQIQQRTRRYVNMLYWKMNNYNNVCWYKYNYCVLKRNLTQRRAATREK